MKIRYFKQEYLDKLKMLKDEAKLNHYKSENCWLNSFFNHENWYAQSKIEIPGNIELVIGDSRSGTDLENSIKVYNALQDKLTPVQACDPRLWAYLCHETFWDYMKWRWPPAKISTIKSRYFVNGSSSRALSRNGLARLWWFAHLTYDKKRSNPYELTGVFLRHQDIQHNLIERNFGRNTNVLHAVLDFLKSRPGINSKDDYVKIGKIINRRGGVVLLDCQSNEQITNYLNEQF